MIKNKDKKVKVLIKVLMNNKEVHHQNWLSMFRNIILQQLLFMAKFIKNQNSLENGKKDIQL